MRAYVNVTITVILLIGCLAVIGELGRVEAGRSYGDGRRADGGASKISLKICVHRYCHTKGEPIATECFCCMNLPEAPCYLRRDECQANCPNLPPSLPASAGGDGTTYTHEQMDGN
ncbi:hypothetical protein CFC21_003699 [Triticum aestivum]|uniref:Embryo surrounding factor 1 brassicaceae domain-containing protein n=1 Tax=Triticum aestivum TaxID=4565 RepID=A0A3B5Y619_WHEAT|nr:hypothetical protein CFC21_003699 [Triticum aestivum]